MQSTSDIPQRSFRSLHSERAQLAVVGLAGLALWGVATVAWPSSDAESVSRVSTTATATTAAPAVAPSAAAVIPADAAADISVDGCTLDVLSVAAGASGESVVCVQESLIAAGYLTGPASGTFDAATAAAVEVVQSERELFVDGVVGRETALALGIWPDEESFVVRTPPPPAGAVDLLGYPLSSVATAGADAPPLPDGSGAGRRLVYDRAGQRVWAVDDDGSIIRSWLISGSKYANELPGTHEVYSRSEQSTAWNGKAYLPLMVRWLKTDIGAIGFHAIPLHVEDNSPYQTDAELGTRLSGGCQRQANLDAAFVWDFAQVGTPVVVV